jgi:hypothetical protein
LARDMFRSLSFAPLSLCATLVRLLARCQLLVLSRGQSTRLLLILSRGNAAWQGLILGRRDTAGRRKRSHLLLRWRRQGRRIGPEIRDGCYSSAGGRRPEWLSARRREASGLRNWRSEVIWTVLAERLHQAGRLRDDEVFVCTPR